MQALFFLLDCFVKHNNHPSFSLLRLGGCLLLAIAAGLGLYFLFKLLIPIIGYIESGATITGILAIIGIIMFTSSHKTKPTDPLKEIISNAEATFLSLEGEAKSFIKANPLKAMLIALAGGVVLSQLKDSKSLPEHIKNIKKLLG